MTVDIGSTTSPEPQPGQPERLNQQTDLAYRYGAIGILAVAAAARYSGAAKSPADTPASSQIDQRFIELAV